MSSVSRSPSAAALPAFTLASLARLQTRFQLVLGGALLALAALLVMSAASSTYNTAYSLFQGIVQDNSVKVNASEQALQHIASASTSLADYLITPENSPTHPKALTAIYNEFKSFRDEMFTLRAGVSDTEREGINTLEKVAYDQFWPQIGIALWEQQIGNNAAARTTYVTINDLLEKNIVPALQGIERTNFEAMVKAEKQAGMTIVGQSFIVGALGFGVAAGVTVLSHWLRRKIRRYLTPGIDGAVVLAWMILILMMSQLLGLPGELKSMVEDAYYSVTASSRVLAQANQANRAESAALLDPDHLTRWQQAFDLNKMAIELRLCGQVGCTAHKFTSGGDLINDAAFQTARYINSGDSASIGGAVPLVANVTYQHEAETLETARRALVDYVSIDQVTRQYIAQNRMADAITLNTGRQVGQSNEAFDRFVSAMEYEKTINRREFDKIWLEQQSALPTNNALLGFGGYLLLIVLIGAGVYHRFREL